MFAGDMDIPPPVWELLPKPRILLPDQALVQFLEERSRLAEGLPRRQLALRSGADGATVVVGQRLVRTRLLLVLDHMLRAEELPVVAQILVQLLRRVRQHRTVR
jgi:hypothetical protein